MVQSRISLLEVAINETLGGNRKLLLKNSIEPSFKNEEDFKSNDHKQHHRLTAANKIKANESQQDSISIPDNKVKSTLSQGNSESEQSTGIDKEIDTKAKNLADFFNGKVLDIEI